MIAIISDVHSNLEALTAVLEDIESQDVKKIYSLGDVVGYGPNPRECVKILKGKVDFSLMGNHEEAVLFDAEDFGAKARIAIEWTREQLRSTDYDVEENYILWDFLANLRKKVKKKFELYVHGSLRQPTREYVLAKDIKDRLKIASIFKEFKKCDVCFSGHTHIPGLITQDCEYYHSDSLKNKADLDKFSGKKIINVGSVGQPRDGDNRACYVVFDGHNIEWRRVGYDYKKTMEKIKEAKGLANYLAWRLEDGRQEIK